MQQQQLAAQLAHHGGGGAASRPPPLSPTPSDSDSDISLGAHSPPISSPVPLRFGTNCSPTPLSQFRFGPHSPGPMPTQFRFGGHTSPSFRLDNRQSPPAPSFRKMRGEESPINVDVTTTTAATTLASSYGLLDSRSGQRLGGESPINVDSDYRNDKDSPIRVVDGSPPQTSLRQRSPPPMNLRIADHLQQRLPPSEGLRIHPETPLPLRLGAPPQLTTPLRIQVTSPSRLGAPPSPQTAALHVGAPPPHAGIVRIVAPPPPPHSPPPQPILHRPFTPTRMT